ncbi:MAG: lipopolysaccharide biosynthesis protein [Chlorobi bacterium]|nr:lipopolysaccharide biosynthesis protein [Chlorobiota bacterium]
MNKDLYKHKESDSLPAEKNKDIENLPIIQDDEIDLIALVKTIWNGRRMIYYSIVVAVFIGLIIAFFSPKKYTASATLLPSAEKKANNLGGLSALAGMAGVNLNSMLGETTGIPAEIYPQVVNSFPFQEELIHQKFNFEEYDYPVSIYDYVVADSVESVGDLIIKYTIKLPWTIKNAIFSKKRTPGINADYGVVNLSEEELSSLKFTKNLIRVDVDDKTGLVTLSAEGKEPVATAQFIQKAVELLQEYVIDYKTSQVRENLEFVKERYKEKQKEYERIQKEFFEYKDRHRNIDPNRVDVKYQQLNDEYEIITSVYKGLAQQLEQAKISVKEQTPVFTVLEPAKVPNEKSSPKRGLILVISILLGGFVGIGLIFGRLIWSKVKEEW